MTELTVYDCEACRVARANEFAGFRRAARLVGPAVSVMKVSSADDLPPGEARRAFEERSFSCLPLTVFDGFVVVEGSYPSDQEIVDYVDVPDGVLPAKRAEVRPANDLESPCSCVHVR